VAGRAFRPALRLEAPAPPAVPAPACLVPARARAVPARARAVLAPARAPAVPAQVAPPSVREAPVAGRVCQRRQEALGVRVALQEAALRGLAVLAGPQEAPEAPVFAVAR
jgi:hypothetical protein